jgi:phosphoribosylanthranilate isomerase
MTKVKICGITNYEDAEASVEFGANALGFIFYRQSPRYIEPERAREIISRIPPFVTAVGVFVNENPEDIMRTLEIARFDVCQLHGDETPEDCMRIPVKTIKAIRVKTSLNKETLCSYPASAILLDSYSEKGYGGTGATFDWNLARGLTHIKPIIISGGLTPENVARAVKLACPYGVDVSSGVEDYPGKKNHQKIKKFIEEARHGDK